MTSALQRALILGLVASCCACGGSSPSAPSVRTTAVNINGSTDMLRVQETATFTATATRSDGSTAAATGWTSSAPNILTINPTTGVATGIAAGTATITATFDGVMGTRSVRVVPEYSGNWSGFYRIDVCINTGDLQLGDWCDTIQSLGPLPFGLTLSQTRDTVTGTVSFGQFFGNVTGTIAADGTLTLTGTASNGPAQLMITAWSTNSTTFGIMTGTFSQRATIAGLSGDATHANTIISASRTPTASASGASGAGNPGESVSDLARALGGR